MMDLKKQHAADVDTEDDDEVGANSGARTTVAQVETVEPLVTNAEPTQWFAHPGARRNSRRVVPARSNPGIKLVDGRVAARSGVTKKRTMSSSSSSSKNGGGGGGGNTSPSALAAGGVKKHLMQRWTTTGEVGGGDGKEIEMQQMVASGKRRRPKLVHYMESGDPVPARYAPGSRLGNLIETELNTVRGMGAARVNVKMNLRGRAKLETFFLSADGVVRAACRIAVPRLVGSAKVLGRDANTIREALADLDNKQLRYLDALQDRLRTRSSTALWSVIVGNQAVGRDLREGQGRGEQRRQVSTVSRLGDGQPAYAPRLRAPE